MTKTKKNSVTFMKQTIKEMILQDSEVTKVLLGNEENNYKNVKELLGKNIYDYLADFSRIKNSTYILYDANLIQRHEDENVVCVSIIITSTVANHDENYNSYIDLLSERISDDIFGKWDGKHIQNYYNRALIYEGLASRNISFQVSVDYI